MKTLFLALLFPVVAFAQDPVMNLNTAGAVAGQIPVAHGASAIWQWPPTNYFGMICLTNDGGYVTTGTLTYQTVSNYSISKLWGFTASAVNGRLTNAAAGWYQITYMLNFWGDADTTDDLTARIYTNGVQLVESEMHLGVLSVDIGLLAGEVRGTLNNTVIIYLPAATTIDLRQMLGTGNVFTIKRATLLMRQLGASGGGGGNAGNFAGTFAGTFSGDGSGLTAITAVKVATGTPASASATGTAGQILYDSSFIYICVSANTWKRVAIATW